jgi:UDP-glucose 4-epimerase
MKVAVTGSTGFVGKRYLQVPASNCSKMPLNLRATRVEDIDLRGTDVIVHLAGKAHDMQGAPDEEYFSVNFDLTRALADRAKSSGVMQFIYISSTKVYGDEISATLDEHSACLPTDAYGKSKLAAEHYLQSISSPDFKVAIVRPPLVYGPEVKGNMIRLLELASKNIPLPLGKTNNARSMVFLDNLVALIDKIIGEEASGLFIAGDERPLSTDELVTAIRSNLGNTSGLVSIPVFMRPLIRKIKPALYTRLFGSFVVDNKGSNQRLNFTPPFSSEEGISVMTRWYLTWKNREHAKGI